MAQRKAFTLPTGKMTPLRTLKHMLDEFSHAPPVGVTQGGSGRRHNRGANSAATNGETPANQQAKEL